MNKIAYTRYSQKSEVYAELQRKAKTYISHFIQVTNLAVQRGDLPPETRDYYNIEEDDKKTPVLNSDKDILSWGERLIKGEANRLSKGLTPVTNPTIAVVKVHYEKFQKANEMQKVLQKASNTAQEKLKLKRIEADELIVNLWNEVENSLVNHSPAEKRELAQKYGVVYVYRKNEKEAFENANYSS